jgi:hypothetical protein
VHGRSNPVRAHGRRRDVRDATQWMRRMGSSDGLPAGDSELQRGAVRLAAELPSQRSGHDKLWREQRELLRESGGGWRRVLPDVHIRQHVVVRRFSHGKRVSFGQVPGDRRAVPSVHDGLERGLPAACRIGQTHALERGERIGRLERPGRCGHRLRVRLGGRSSQPGQPHERHAGMRPHVRDVDGFGDGRREPPDELHELVGGVRLLHLGRRVSAKRRRVGVRGSGWKPAARVPVGLDGSRSEQRVRDLRQRSQQRLLLPDRYIGALHGRRKHRASGDGDARSGVLGPTRHGRERVSADDGLGGGKLRGPVRRLRQSHARGHGPLPNDPGWHLLQSHLGIASRLQRRREPRHGANRYAAIGFRCARIP